MGANPLFWVWRMPKAIIGCVTLSIITLVAALAMARRPFEIVPPQHFVAPMGTLVFESTRELASVDVQVDPPVEGAFSVKGKRIEMTPHNPLRPGATYHVSLSALESSGERLDQVFSVRVDPLYEALWVYVKLDSDRHRVDVYQGDALVRTMIASGGRPGHETPAGVFRIQNRGYHFFSQKYQEGAYYWVRIFGNYLFHSVPVDIDGNVIQEEAEKLGCPASHGCVRLSFPDAQWFYETVPDGTLVVIDRT